MIFYYLNSFSKRVIDILGSIFCLILFSPIFIIISILIKNSSEGPIFFKQERIGKFGKKFILLKFRTMYINNDNLIHENFVSKFINGEKIQDNIYKIQNDHRIFPIGRILRKFSLDEIPQFINILKGEMSIVGPRPPLYYEFKQYEKWHKERLNVNPGITGLWQIYGRSKTSFNEMVQMDLKYIKNWNIFLDIRIILQTPLVIFSCRGAF